MRHLKDFLECNFATPANTAGMGNPIAPNGCEVGSEPLVPTAKLKKKKNKNKAKQ